MLFTGLGLCPLSQVLEILGTVFPNTDLPASE